MAREVAAGGGGGQAAVGRRRRKRRKRRTTHRCVYCVQNPTLISSTLSFFYKGWLIRDGNMRLVEISKFLGMETTEDIGYYD